MKTTELLRKGLAELGLALPEKQLARLELYFLELKKWNRRINLVADAPDQQLLETHFLDSLALLPLLDPCPPPGLVDVGSGAGFPGLALKIARPDLPVTLVEPRQKRTAFLRQVIRLLELPDIRVMECRLEKEAEVFSSWRDKVPLFTSRAFTAISPFLDLCENYCAPGGRVICMKGRRAEEELTEWRQQQPGSLFTLEQTVEIILPFTKAPRKLLVFSKT